MRLRSKNTTLIQYILVSHGSPLISPNLPPDSLNNHVINFIKVCPSDLLQLNDSIPFFESCLRELWYTPYDFQIFNVNDYKIVEELIKESPQLQLIFLDGQSIKHLELHKLLKGREARYFHFYNQKSEDFELINVFNPTHFISTVVQEQEQILKFLEIENIQLNPSVQIEYKNFNERHYFVPTRTNFSTINKIIGNFGSSSHELSEKEILQKSQGESKKAHSEPNAFTRQNLLIDQVKKIDFYRRVSYVEGIIKPGGAIDPILSSLILILPFSNPDLSEIFVDKEITNLMQVEQSKNYVNSVSTAVDEQMFLSSVKIVANRTAYLDKVAFLHSSFDFGPVIRLPAKGKSVYRNLSFFRTQAFVTNAQPKARKKLKKSILNFGKLYSESTLSPKLDELIKKRNGQIVAISDIPVEWLLVDGIPLGFSHDVCRLPETSLHGLMSLFMHSKTFEYFIPNDILNKTLVILGADDKAFLPLQEMAIDLSKELGFNVVRCRDNSAVKNAINKYRPDFLIFDCHGGYDNKSKTTHLHIGNDILDGHTIIKDGISAPLVFLSACGTAPTYGTINTVANAFFEAGALSVTTTYIPIMINTASTLYLRILNNLSYAATKPIHKNWLNFISHMIRSSSISEAHATALLQGKGDKSQMFFDANVNALNDSLVFEKRRDLYKELDSRINSLTNENKKYFDEVVPEYLAYSNLGRSDLIYFESWKESFQKNNVF